MQKKTQSIWLNNAKGPDFPALKGNIHVDVAIIGAGMTGLTAAWILKNSGKKVAVIEKNKIIHGESGMTTAHLTEIPDGGCRELIQTFGIEKAKQVIASQRAAIHKIKSIIETLAIDCSWEHLPAYLYAETTEQLEYLRKEITAFKLLGINAEMEPEVPLPYPTEGGIRVENQAQFNPAIYLSALAGKIHGDGSVIFENSLVENFKENKDCRVITATGSVTAQNVIWATHVPVSNLVLIQTKLAAYRSYAVAVPAPMPLRGLFWDINDPYHYIRNQRINGADFLIVGGEDHKTGSEKDTASRFQALENFTFNHFHTFDFTHRWSGQIIETVDGLPYIGRNAFSKKSFVATGFSGTGMTFGTLSAMIISDIILGHENSWESIYSPSRITLSSLPVYLRENKDFPAHLTCDYLKKHHDTLNDLKPGEGRIVGSGLSSKAVSCDENGTVHVLSAICPHLGCLVGWNSAERTWDCPCHGSRFNQNGQVVNGPAHTNLKPAEQAMHMRDKV